MKYLISASLVLVNLIAIILRLEGSQTLPFLLSYGIFGLLAIIAMKFIPKNTRYNKETTLMRILVFFFVWYTISLSLIGITNNDMNPVVWAAFVLALIPFVFSLYERANK